MRSFNYSDYAKKLLTPELIKMLSNLHEYKGKQEALLETDSDDLRVLLNVAKIQSTGSSNRIEGIFTTDKRLKEIVVEKSKPQNRSESEIAGYREVLSTIHENHDYISLKPGMILQMHRDLYSYVGNDIGGHYKDSDNLIAETDSEGKQKVRFIPVPAFQTSDAIEKLCFEFSKVWNENLIDKLILIPMFVLDFLCIHPFNDGNGRISRLLTLLLLYKAGYFVGKYISLEMIIEKSEESYYESLQMSSLGWHEENNNYEPFVKYYLGVLAKACLDFENRINLLRNKNLSKPQQIQKIIEQKVGKITKQEIMNLCPNISKVTVERTLTSLVKSGYIQKIGNGPKTAYVKR